MFSTSTSRLKLKSSTPASVERAGTLGDHEPDCDGVSDFEALEAEVAAQAAEALAAAARKRARLLRVQSELPKRESRLVSASAPELVGGEGQHDPASDSHIETSEGEEVDCGALPSGPATPTPSTSAPRRRMRRLVIVSAFALCTLTTIGAGAASAWMLSQHHGVLARQHRAAEFTAAARQGVVTFMSMDHDHARQSVQRIIDNSTGDLRADMTQHADDFTALVQGSKIVTTAEVNATALQSMTNDSAVVLATAVSHVSNAGGPDNAPREWRLRVTLQRDGGQLKIGKVEFVP